ncbi:MAG: hypothetical protein AAB662_04680 [Patescibacteria group bacterium]
MNVYFTASTQSLKLLSSAYINILKILKNNNCKNLNSYIEKRIQSKQEKIKVHSRVENNIYTKSLKLINKSALLIAEITYPSITVGRQIEFAIQKNIPVLCLSDVKKNAYISPSIFDTEIYLQTFRSYDVKTLQIILNTYLINFIKPKIRFNFFVTREIENFLNWLSLKKGMRKSSIIRELIEKDMKNHPGFFKSR